jgi:hypothetical protein
MGTGFVEQLIQRGVVERLSHLNLNILMPETKNPAGAGFN